jgi:RimJ/RimL family protein N-acetyltransferase
MSEPWGRPVTLHGDRLALTPLRLSDAPAFVAALGTAEEAAEVTAHLSYRVPDLTAARRVVATLLTTPGQQPLGQRLVGTGELVGTTSYYDVDPVRRSLAIGHTWLARRHWRTGLNTESKLLLLTHAFDTLSAERVVWHTDIRNTRSQAAIERLGATREGVLRHHRTRPDGSWRDTVQFAMVAAEWPSVRARLQGALTGGAR